MSSSDEDIQPVPIKRIKRKKYCLDNPPIREIDLFTRNFMPALSNNQKSVLQLMKLKEESKPQVKPKPKLVVDNVCMVEKSSQSDEEVNIIGEESPIKPLPVTPPPERVLGCYSNDKQLEKKKMKLLRNVASVLKRTKEDNMPLISYTPESNDHDASNDCVVVKVRFQSKIHKYATKKTVNFNHIFQCLATVGETKNENLLLILNDRRIYPDDTPDMIGLTVVDFIDAVIMDEQVLEESKKDESNKQNFINVHFQSKFVKQKQTYSVNKFNPFSETMSIYAKLIGYKLDDLCFLFDGDVIDGSLTAIQLEIDDDYCIDVAKVNK